MRLKSNCISHYGKVQNISTLFYNNNNIIFLNLKKYTHVLKS